MPGPVLILVDIAHADSAVALLSHAKETFADANLHVAYVMPFGFYSYVEPYVSQDSLRAAGERAKAELAALVARADLTDQVTRHVLRGGIGDQCLGLADQLGTSRIVLNASRSGGSHMNLGAHAAQIARHALCSVYLVRS